MDSGVLWTFGALLSNLSNASDFLSLDVYKFDINSLRLIYDYLGNIKRRGKINNTYSSWREILCGMSQWSILRQVLFNSFLCNLFYFLEATNIANYINDGTPDSAADTKECIIEKFKYCVSFVCK